MAKLIKKVQFNGIIKQNFSKGAQNVREKRAGRSQARSGKAFRNSEMEV